MSSEFNDRGKMPFKVIASCVSGGYTENLSGSVGINIELVNYHKDEYSELEATPLQGPFTEQHVGGNQHRHVDLNTGNDNQLTRPEAFDIETSPGSLKIYGPEVGDINKPRAQRTRGLLAKSPVNIKNIETSGNIAGNFENNYQVVQTVGRRTTNNLINDGFEASGSLTTKFVSGSHEIYTLPDITNNSKSIFVERFNAPGGKEESSRGALDREGEEYAPNNSLVTRNIKVRQPYYSDLAKHSKKSFTSKDLNYNDFYNLKLNNLLFKNEISIFERTPGGFFISDDGTNLYTVGRGSTSFTGDEQIQQYVLNTPWDITTAVVKGFFSLFTSETQPTGIFFKPDGKKCYIVGFSGDNIREFNLDVAWDITTANYSADFNILSQDTSSEDIFIRKDGKKIYVVGSSNNKIYQYSLNSAWNISSGVVFEKDLLLNSPLTNTVKGVQFSLDGRSLYILNDNGAANNTIIKYYLSIPWDIASAKEDERYNIESLETIPRGININQEFLYILGGNSVSTAKVKQFLIQENTSIHGVNKNSLNKINDYYNDSFITSSRNDNFWVQHAIPSTDLRYKWIAESISNNQQPIEYQSYNLPYSTGSSYSANGAFSDIEFTQTGPFGDHLGISGAIDKDEMHVSTYTNTMYRDRKALLFLGSESEINLDIISSEITEKDFTFSFWAKIPLDVPQSGVYRFFSYSGSFGENYLTLFANVSFSLSPWSIESFRADPSLQNDITTLYSLSGYNNDNKWHLVTLVNDNSTSIRRLNPGSRAQTAVDTTNVKVYVDGALVKEVQQNFTKTDIQKITLSAGATPYENTVIDDIAIWDRALDEKEILEIYRISKTLYGERPRKYLEHKYNNILSLQPIHIYSSRVDETNTVLFDEIGNKNATLIGFNSSNITPQDTGIISYSTYFNGPYEGASWKSIRNNEHPVTRKLTTENTNIVSVTIPEGTKKATRVVRGIPVTFQLPGSRKQGKLLNIKECPVYINNKPLKHRFILKDSANQDIATEVIHTYGNNLQYFANQELNDTLGLAKTDRQMYDVLRDYYTGETEEIENPIQKFVGFTYSETIFPKNGQGLLKTSRQRTDYITDQPGYSIDGYDRQLGTQRVFWRDNQEDRMRTRRTYITSLGDQVESVYDLPFQTPSVAALEYISESNTIEHIRKPEFPLVASVTDISYKNSAELNNQLIWVYDSVGEFGPYAYFSYPANQVPEIYYFKDTLFNSRIQYNAVLRSGLYPDQSSFDPSSLRLTPSLFHQHGCVIFRTGSFSPTMVYDNFTQDLGLNRLTEKISGKNPWYDSYEEYYVDIKNLSNDKLISYSKIPEFIISNHISSLVGEYGGDATKITIDEYTDNLQFTYKKSIDRENKDMCEEDTINIVVDGVKKLLPYNGFYPQDRSLQLVNYLKESWLDTNSIGGGLLITSSLHGQNIFRDTGDRLVQFLKESAFLEPLYSPGIFYNLIKSGIAVDWSVYTGSLPVDNYINIIPLAEKPQFRISFESLINLYNIPLSSSSDTLQNRIIKYKEIDQKFDSIDYNPPGSTLQSFQGFFEKLKEGSPLYALSINNFLAETINFFLKDSSLNTFISKPDSDFATLDSSKTYYMDVVLRKNDIVMCEAHSSSLADSFGKMSGRYFGPSFWTGSVSDEQRIRDQNILTEALRDPGYCAYTPPYYYGDSVARISFKPDTTRKYSLDEIFADMQIENFNTSFVNNSVYPSGSLYSSFVMPIESSVTIKGEIEQREQTVDIASRNTVLTNAVRRNLQNLVGTATSQTGIKRWVISPKMETPVLDFSNQEFVTSTTILTQSYVDIELGKNPDTIGILWTPPTASGFGRGMWSGYGEIPEGEKGIFLELRESYPRQLIGVLNPFTRQFVETNTGSLLQACGFQQTNDKLSQRIGELADTREISEAIVIIPYLDRASTGKTIRFGGGFSTLTVNDTVEIEGHNFIKINQNIFNYQKTNVLANKPAVDLADFSVGNTKIQETSISRMLELMSKYVLPPNFDFLLNNDVTPFVMYIAEFTSTLDKQDLADIWQGVMPKIATTAEWEKQTISHKNTQFDFFHGQGLPEDVKFMIFKAKKRAEINYYKMTADAKDDKLFPSIQAGKPPSPYSFNWPYDYCSLVETARVDVEIEYINKSGSNNT